MRWQQTYEGAYMQGELLGPVMGSQQPGKQLLQGVLGG